MISTLQRTKQLFRQSEALVSVCQVRWASLSTESKLLKIDKNISYRRAAQELDNEHRPLVVMYGWLVAKAKHIYKYGDYYLGKGFDVVHVKVKPGQILFPPKNQRLIYKVLDLISEEEHKKKPLLIHGFSVGGYLCGEMYVAINGMPGKYGQVGRRIQGQVLDSPADLESIPYGFSKALTPVPIVQSLMERSLNGYLSTFKNSVTKHYRKSSDIMYENKLKLPSLVYYSDVDPVGLAGPIENLIAGYRKHNIPTFSRKFIGSPHVSHFHHYPVEYIEELNMFLKHIRLGQSHENEEVEKSKATARI